MREGRQLLSQNIPFQYKTWPFPQGSKARFSSCVIVYRVGDMFVPVYLTSKRLDHLLSYIVILLANVFPAIELTMSLTFSALSQNHLDRYWWGHLCYRLSATRCRLKVLDPRNTTFCRSKVTSTCKVKIWGQTCNYTARRIDRLTSRETNRPKTICPKLLLLTLQKLAMTVLSIWSKH